MEAVEKPAKKVKKSEPDIVQNITVYVEIQAQASWQQSKASKKTEVKPVIKKGPSFFTVEDSFDTFKEIIAKAIPCKLKLLPVGNMEWRYEKPGNDPRKPLTSTEGYKAMTMSLSERKSGFVVYISIPPPKVDDVVCFYNNFDAYITYFQVHFRPGTLVKVIMSTNLTITIKKLPWRLQGIFQQRHRL
jgi:hypothetical protein